MNSGFASQIYRVRADAFYVATEEGVWLRNNTGSFSIKGKSSYQLVKSLFAHLDGTKTVEEICAGLSAAQQEAVTRLVQTLEQRGFIKAWKQPTVAVPDWAEQLFGNHLAYIEYLADEPFERFMQFRGKRLLCIGQGSMLRCLVVALLEHGAGQIEVWSLEPEPAAAGALADLRRAAVARDPALHLQIRTGSARAIDAPAVTATGRPFDCVLFASDRDDAPAIREQCGKALGAGIDFAAVSAVGHLLVASPLVTSDAGFCWECMYRAIVPTDEGAGAGVVADVLAAAPAPASMAAHQEAHTLFCHYAGLPHREDATCTTIDSSTLSTRIHRISRHPACPYHVTPASER
jgi:hypothetical protein